MKIFARILTVFTIVWMISRSMIYLLPGSPEEYLVHESLVQVDEATLKRKLDLPASPLARIFSFPRNESLIKKETASHLIKRATQNSLLLALTAFALTFLWSALSLYFSFVYQRVRESLDIFSVALASLPLFVLSPLLLRFCDLPNPLLPALALSLSLSAFWYRTLQQKIDLYRVKSSEVGARARGKKEIVIFFKDILFPILGSFLVFFGTQIGTLFNGSLIVEIIFHWNGLGSLLTDAVLSRDYPVIELCLLTVTLITLFSQQTAYTLKCFLEAKT